MSPQLKVLVAGFILMWLMGLFPPWVQTNFHGYQNSQMVQRDAGRDFLFDRQPRNTQINLALLLKQWIVVSGITVGIVLWITRLQRKHQARQRRFEHNHHMHQAWDETDGGG